MTASSEIYERLREKLDALGFGLPESGPVDEGDRPEIRVLKELFTPEDAEVFVAMRSGYQTAESFAAASGHTLEFARQRLYELSKRGLLYRRGGEEGLEYRLIPMAHGVFEFNVNDEGLPKWFLPFAEYLGASTFMVNVTGTDTPFERTVPCNAEYVEGGALPQDDIVSLVNGMEDCFAITDCLCRKAPHVAIGAPLKHPLRTCMYTGEWARYAVENGFAERASREEILAVIHDTEPGGRMVQVLNSEKPEVICSCDGEACLVLVQHKLRIPGPARALRSNYDAVLDLDTCTSCGVCVERCPIGALEFDEASGTVEVDLGMCCGCGLCVGACEEHALKLVKKAQVYAPVGCAFSGYDRQAAYRGADPNAVTVS
jgi:Na+-translocating ferredoxin:NAD+ oxidoreductase subunit B